MDVDQKQGNETSAHRHQPGSISIQLSKQIFPQAFLVAISSLHNFEMFTNFHSLKKANFFKS